MAALRDSPIPERCAEALSDPVRFFIWRRQSKLPSSRKFFWVFRGFRALSSSKAVSRTEKSPDTEGRAAMTTLRRIYLCCFLVLTVLGTALPVQAQSESEPPSESEASITLGQEMTAEVPATAGRLLLSDVEELDSAGAILVEPGTENEELVEYESVEDNTLVNIIRDDPRPHEVGVAVEQSEEDISASPSPNPTPTPTASPSPSPTPTASANPVPLPSTYPVGPGSDEPASEPESSPDSASTESIALAQDMNFLIPGDGGGLLLTGVSGLDPSGGAVLVDPGSPIEEIVFYQNIDLTANALVDIERPTPGFHNQGAPVIASSETQVEICDPDIYQEECEQINALINQYCSDPLQCDVEGLLQAIIAELCSEVGGCSTPLQQLIEDLILDVCGPNGPTKCNVAGFIAELKEAYCPELPCLEAGGLLIDLIIAILEDNCGYPVAECADYVATTVLELVDELCPGLQCADDELDFAVQFVTSTLNSVCGGDPRTACEPYITSIISGLITELCGPSGLEGCEGVLTEQVEELIATWCPNGPPDCRVVPPNTGLTQLQVWDINIKGYHTRGRDFVERMRQNPFAPDIITVNELPLAARNRMMEDIGDVLGGDYEIVHSDGGVSDETQRGNNAVIYNQNRLAQVGEPATWRARTGTTVCTSGKYQLAVDFVDTAYPDVLDPKHVLVAAVHFEGGDSQNCLRANTVRTDEELEGLEDHRDLTIIGGDFNERPVTTSIDPIQPVRSAGLEIDPDCWYREFSAAHLDIRIGDPGTTLIEPCPTTQINRYYDTVWVYPGSGGGTNPAAPTMCEQWTFADDNLRSVGQRSGGTACTKYDALELHGFGRIDFIWVGWETSSGDPFLPPVNVATGFVDYASADLGFNPEQLVPPPTPDTADPEVIPGEAYSDHRAVQALLTWPATP